MCMQWNSTSNREWIISQDKYIVPKITCFGEADILNRYIVTSVIIMDVTHTDVIKYW